MEEKVRQELTIPSTSVNDDDEDRTNNLPTFYDRGTDAIRESLSSLDSGSSLLLLVFKEVKRPRRANGIVLATSASGCGPMCGKSSRYKEVSREITERIKGLSRKLKKSSRKSLDAIKEAYKDASAKKAKGFKCNLKECNGRVLDCGQSLCKEKDALFGKEMRSFQKESLEEDLNKLRRPRQLQIECKPTCKFAKGNNDPKPEIMGKLGKRKQAENERQMWDKLKDSKVAKHLADTDIDKWCKRHRVCECPDNPGKYLKMQGRVICCCLEDSCVTLQRKEDKGHPDFSKEILRTDYARLLQEN